MSEDYEIRCYRPGDETGILASFNHVFREVCGESYVDRGLEFWNWEFARAPGGHRITVGLTGAGAVAAHYGGVVYPMTTAYGDATFVHIVDSFVLPEHRAGLKRPGLFVTTAYPWFELCREMGDAVLYGYPVKTAERIGQRYLDYKLLRVVTFLSRNALDGSTDLPDEITVERVTAVPAETDELFARFAADKHCLTTRNRRFLDWRYVQIPGDSYEIFAARRDGDLVGLMVLRPQNELLPGACAIADWVVPPDDTVTDALLATATARARDQARSVLLAVFADPSVEFIGLRARGFTAAVVEPHLERRLTHRIYHPQMTSEWLSEHWWYTLGDSDLV